MPEVRYTVTTINTGSAGQDLRSSTCAWSTARTASAASTRCRCRCASGWRASPASPSPTSACSTGRRQEADLQFSLQGPTWPSWSACGAPDGPQLRAIPGLVDLDSTLKPDKPTWRVDSAARRRRRPGPERQRRWPTRCARWWPARRWATGAPATARPTTCACAWRPSPRRPQRPGAPAAATGSNADGSAAHRAAEPGGRRARRHRPQPDQPPRPDAARSTSTPTCWAAAPARCRPTSARCWTASPGRRATATVRRLTKNMQESFGYAMAALAWRHLHLHDPGQPVQELPAAAGADEQRCR
jgi:hypothetical protein